MSLWDGEAPRRTPKVRPGAGPPPSEHDRLGASAAFATILVLGLAVLVGWWWAHHEASGHIAHGTSVAGVDVGGRSPQDAVATLKAGLATRAVAPVSLDVGGRIVKVSPAAAGLSVDYQASIDQVVSTDSWHPSQLWDYFTGGGRTAPVISVDEPKLRVELTHLAQQLGVAPRNATISFSTGTPRVVHARNGQGLDVNAVAAALRRSYLTGQTATVPLTSVPPQIGDAAVQAVLNHVVNRAVSAPVTLRFGKHPYRLDPHRFATALVLTPVDGRLVLHVDAAKLAALVRPATQGGAPVDATVRIVDGKPRVVPARRGTVYAPSAIASTFLRLIGRPEKARTGSVSAQIVTAAFDDQSAYQLLIHDRVATATVSRGVGGTGYSQLVQQADAVDGTVLRPRQVFSLASKVHPRTAGDLTQLATALYNASFFAGLADVAHHSPSTHVAGLPLGREATGPDLQFRNDTPYGVLVQAQVSSRGVTVTLWSTRYHSVTAATSCREIGSGVGQVTTSRIFRPASGGAVTHVEKSVTNYPGLPAATCAHAASTPSGG